MSKGIAEAQKQSTIQNAKRRKFLKLGVSVSAAAGGGLLLGFSLPAKASTGAAPDTSVLSGDGDEASKPNIFKPNAFIQISAEGRVTLVIPKVEMGQGIYTSIPMLIAEELEVSMDNVHIAHAPPDAKLFTDPLLGGQLTGGSTSIRYAWVPMREAGAAARTLLISAAAQMWHVDPTSCHAQSGQVIHAESGRRADYGLLVDAAAKLPPPHAVTLKDPKDFKIIGTMAKRLDSPEKVNGSAVFGLDVRLPNMVYAVIVQCPVFGGKLKDVDDKITRSMPGVQQVVKFDNGVAVIGDHTWAAKRGASALTIEWDEGAGAHYTTEQVVRDLVTASQRQGAPARIDGNIDKGFHDATSRVDAVYQQPFLAHATMEPLNCTVWVQADACDIWVGTQVPTRAVDTAVSATGLAADKIRLHNHLLGGGFGRRLETDFIGQALKVGMQVDRPVKVTWTREEDIQQDMFRPYYYDVISAGLDANGRPIAWQHKIVGSSIIARFFPPIFKNGLDPDAIEVAAELLYDLPNQQVHYVRQEPLHVPTAFWRGVGPLRSTFVVESFIDELATHAKKDPIAYRLDLLRNNPRATHVLETAADASNWHTPLASDQGQGRGISFMHAFNSFLGMVVDVTVNDKGEVRVDRVVCIVDCGMVVNPNTIEAQIQGGIIFGITGALYNEITIKDGRVEQSNFTDYRILRIDQAPPIQVHIVKSSEAPGGIGEPGTAALAAALTNAIFAATGKRIRQLPVGGQLAPALRT